MFIHYGNYALQLATAVVRLSSLAPETMNKNYLVFHRVPQLLCFSNKHLRTHIMESCLAYLPSFATTIIFSWPPNI